MGLGGLLKSRATERRSWWTGRDLNPRPYGAVLVPSRIQGRKTTCQAGDLRPALTRCVPG